MQSSLAKQSLKQPKPSKSILDFWPLETPPRESQKELLLQASKLDWDVLVIIAPTAAGKSAIGNTLLRYVNYACGGTGAYLVPNNLLLDQFLERFNWATIRRKDLYRCKDMELSCAEVKKKFYGHCKNCSYKRAWWRMKKAQEVALTIHMYVAQKLRRQNILIDEAHTVLPIIRSFEASRVWKHQVHYPDNLTDIRSLKTWLDSINHPNSAQQKLIDALSSFDHKRFLIEKTMSNYRGEPKECLALLPLDISQAKPYIWPGAKKIILMSATINATDIKLMGLDSKRVKYLEIPSPIPAHRRPVYLQPLGSFSYVAQEVNYPKLADLIVNKHAKYPHAKGLVHITYSMAEALKKYLPQDWIMWHNRDNKAEVYKRWLQSPPETGKVLMACGMQEGLSLLDDLGRWQIIAKVPWPSLADSAIYYMSQQSPEWYQWEALKLVVQAAGRICRAPTDWGETTITDQSFFRFNKALMPQYFKDALIGIDFAGD